MEAAEIDYADIQGLLRFGYAHLKQACFVLLQVKDPAAARAWLATAPVTSAVKVDPPPSSAMQIAFTWEGLRALGLDESILEQFSLEFATGLAQESRARRLGDSGANAPGGWSWGGPSGPNPQVMVLLYAGDDLAGRLATLQEQLASGFDVLARLETSTLEVREPFGFRDGISQPVPDWQRTRRGGGQQMHYTNIVALGEFLLGYPNEYGQYTDRPLVYPDRDPAGLLPAAENRPGARDLGRNGTYLVLRQLHQDVPGFWRFLDREVDSDASAREALAAAMVGRTRDGEPLAPPADRPIPSVGDARLNGFTYEQDALGTRCPLGAHVRRGNPRNADFPPGTEGRLGRLIRTLGLGRKDVHQDLIASTRFHRLLRRGRSYGDPLTPEQALAGGRHSERGLHFICLCANISRQFEFVQNAWIATTKFNGLAFESDPLLGTRAPVTGCPATDVFTRPQPDGIGRRVTGLPQFVRVRGGAYFFLPGIRALRYLASLGG